MRLVACVAILILLAPCAWSMPFTIKGDFFATINQFIYHSTEDLVVGFLHLWDRWLYGEYTAMLEQDLSSIDPKKVHIDLPGGYLNQGSQESLTHLANAQDAIKRAKAKQEECKRLKDGTTNCFLCVPEYHVKLCAKEFFKEFEEASTELNHSLVKALGQISTDYLAYKHYGIDATHSTSLDGCYLYALDIYNEMRKYEQEETIQHIRQEEKPGECIVLAISSSSKDFVLFFNQMAANEGSLIPSILKKHKECRQIEADLLKDYAEKTQRFTQELFELEDPYASIKDQKICLLEKRDLDAIQPSKAASLAQSIDFRRQEKLIGKDPKQSCQIIEKNLKELKQMKTRAIADKSQDGYLVKALKQIYHSDSLITQTEENLAYISIVTTGITSTARSKAYSLRREARAITGLETQVLEQYGQDIREAEESLENAESKTTVGGSAKALAISIRKFEQILSLYSTDPKEEEVQQLIDKAETRILLAGSDGLDTTLENTRLESARQAMDRNYLLFARIQAQHILDSIEQKATGKYAELPELREKINENIRFLPSAKKQTFLKYEKYYTPNLDYNEALGNLKEMTQAYLILLSLEEKEVRDNLKEIIEAGIEQRVTYLDALIADEPIQLILECSFTNPTSFQLPPASIELVLDIPPIGAITRQNMMDSRHIDPETIAYASEKLSFSTPELPAGSGFTLTVSYPAMPATLLSFKRQITADSSNTQVTYTATPSLATNLERVLIPLEEDIQQLSNKYPEDFPQLNGKQYLAIWYPDGKYERTFEIPSTIRLERENTNTELKGDKATIYETIYIGNPEAFRIDQLEYAIDINAKATDVKGVKYSEGKLRLRSGLNAYEQKTLEISYTIEDKTFYCKAFYHQVETEIEAAQFQIPEQLRMDAELAGKACDSGDLPQAVASLTSISSSIGSLRQVFLGNTREKETFERYNQTVHDLIAQAEEANQFSELLGTPTTDIKEAKDRLAEANRLFERGDIKSATTEIKPFLKLSPELSTVNKALEKKKIEIREQVQQLFELKKALSLLEAEDDLISGLVEQTAIQQTAYELALVSKNKTATYKELSRYQRIYDNTSTILDGYLNRQEGKIDALIQAKYENISSLLAILDTANYSVPLGLHLPYSVEQWAKQQGMTSKDIGYERARQKHLVDLTESLSLLRTLESDDPKEKLLYAHQTFNGIETGQTRDFVAQMESEINEKRKDANDFLSLATEQSIKGRLTKDAATLLSKSKQHASAGRYLDSIAYTGFAIATGTRPPNQTPKIAAFSILLLIILLLIYTKRDTLKKYIGNDEDEMEAAERRISFRKFRQDRT